ncbi:uncharacterized protein LOC110698030 isoform X2 [Chenopodium quinoa]|uniref:uncharacterized protein LOC110698030 isoform X2 n=1 Tax=Chenopodium quinoa TaxID=63459 RepID=UPI000B7787E5|nr:uncharacterized protein LOC110698030 isoform X2 [Chenopodium quinoa]
MVSLIAAASSGNLTLFSHQPISYLNSPNCFPVVFVISPLKREHPFRSMTKQFKQKKLLNQFFFEFSGFCGVVRKCKNWEVEGDPALELEVLDFMKNSKKPQKFPSKKELIDAGRMDLLDAIMERGGWMTVGWEDEGENWINENGLASKMEVVLEKKGKIGSVNEERSGSDANGERPFAGTSFMGDFSPAPSSSGRSRELATEDESGIEGILNRLERQRNLSFGFKLGKNGTEVDNVNGGTGDHKQTKGTRKDVDSSHPQRSEPASLSQDRRLISGNGLNRSYSNRLSMKADAWRSWSIQRAGFSDTEFEAGEIDFGKTSKRGTVDKFMGGIGAVTNDIRGAQDETKNLDSNYREITQGDTKTRLQHLEGELSSVLQSLRSNTIDTSGKAREDLSKDLRQLSDVSEFQENEMMNAQDKLRTLRAKLAVLEGKMSLAIIVAVIPCL